MLPSDTYTIYHVIMVWWNRILHACIQKYYHSVISRIKCAVDASGADWYLWDWELKKIK